jgi:hypothetical protein
MPSSSSPKGSSKRQHRRESDGLQAATLSVSVVEDPNLDKKSSKSSKKSERRHKAGSRSYADPAGYVSRAYEDSYVDNERNPLTVASATEHPSPEGEMEESELFYDT